MKYVIVALGLLLLILGIRGSYINILTALGIPINVVQNGVDFGTNVPEQQRQPGGTSSVPVTGGAGVGVR